MEGPARGGRSGDQGQGTRTRVPKPTPRQRVDQGPGPEPGPGQGEQQQEAHLAARKTRPLGPWTRQEAIARRGLHWPCHPAGARDSPTRQACMCCWRPCGGSPWCSGGQRR